MQRINRFVITKMHEFGLNLLPSYLPNLTPSNHYPFVRLEIYFEEENI